MLPQMVDDTVCSCCDVCHLGGLVSGHIEDLDSPCRDLYFMVVEMPMPLNGGKLSRQVFGDKILDPDQGRFWIGGFKQQTLEDLVGNALAVMMKGAAWSPIRHHVRRLDMNLVSDGWTCRLSAHCLLGGHSAASNGRYRDNG
jgi:hypothetical protein